MDSDSDVKLVNQVPLAADSDSDVKLIEPSKPRMSDSDSDVRLAKSDSDVKLVPLQDSDSDVKLIDQPRAKKMRELTSDSDVALLPMRADFRPTVGDTLIDVFVFLLLTMYVWGPLNGAIMAKYLPSLASIRS